MCYKHNILEYRDELHNNDQWIAIQAVISHRISKIRVYSMFQLLECLLIPVCYTGIIHANEAINLNKASDSCV